MADLDSILNAVIPWIIAVAGIYLLYRPLKEPLAPLFNGISNFINAIKQKITRGDKDEELYIGRETLEYE